MRKVAKILIPLAIICFLASIAVYCVATKDTLAERLATVALEWEKFFRLKKKADVVVFAASGGVMLVLGFLRAILRRKNKGAYGIDNFIVLCIHAFFIYISRGVLKELIIKDATALQYVAVGLYGGFALFTLISVFFSDKKAEKRPFKYKALDSRLYLISILGIIAVCLYAYFAKDGFENVGEIAKDVKDYLWDFKSTWVQPKPRIMISTAVALSVATCALIALLKRKRNILPGLYSFVALGIVLVYRIKKTKLTTFVTRSINNEILNNIFIVIFIVMVIDVCAVAIIAIAEELISLFDPNEEESVQVVYQNAEVKALAAEVVANEAAAEEETEEEEPTVKEEAAPVQATEEVDEDEEEDEEEEDTPAPVTKVVAKPAQANEYADEDYDAYDDEDEDDDDDDEEDDEDEDDEDEDEEDGGADDAREALRRRRELIRQRILAARADDDDEEDVEEDEVVGYDDEDEDDEYDEEEAPAYEPETEAEEEVVEDEESEEAPVADEEPVDEESLEEEEEDDEEVSDVYAESIAADDEEEEEDDEESSEDDEYDEDEAPAYDPELDTDEEESEDLAEETSDEEALDEESFDEEALDEESFDDEEEDEDDDDEIDAEEAPVLEDDDSFNRPEFTRIKSKPMKEKMVTILDDEKRERYNAVRNELQSYKKVSERMSAKGDSFRHSRELIAKIDISGKTLKLHLALNPDDFQGTKYAFQDLSAKSKYMYTPLTVKLSSKRSVKHSIELIGMVAQAFGLEKNPKYKTKDYASEIVEAFEAEKANEESAE